MFRLCRRMTGVALCATIGLQWGCYTYQPVQSAPPAVQERMAVTLSDRGRLALADRLGSNVEQVEGVLLGQDSAGVVVAVARVTDVRGGSALWSGEEVTIPTDAILGYRTRTLSKAKTFLLAGGLVATLGVLTFGTTLDVFGGDQPEGGPIRPPTTGETSTRIPVGGIVPLP
jgi:hypothetical protein